MDFEQRLSRLERSATRWRMLAIAGAISTASVLALGLERDAKELDADMIRTRDLRVVDPSGNLVASLNAAKDGGAEFKLYNGKASPISISSEGTHPAITLTSINDKATDAVLLGDGGIIASNGKRNTSLSPNGIVTRDN